MSNHNDTYGLDPKLVKLMEDQLNELCPVEYRPNENVCDIYPRYRRLAKELAYNLQQVKVY